MGLRCLPDEPAVVDARFRDEVEEVTALAQLEDEVQLALLLEGLVELDDVGVVQHLHDGDLVAEGVELVRLDLEEVDGLDSVHVLCNSVSSPSYRCEAALTCQDRPRRYENQGFSTNPIKFFITENAFELVKITERSDGETRRLP